MCLIRRVLSDAAVCVVRLCVVVPTGPEKESCVFGRMMSVPVLFGPLWWVCSLIVGSMTPQFAGWLHGRYTQGRRCHTPSMRVVLCGCLGLFLLLFLLCFFLHLLYCEYRVDILARNRFFCHVERMTHKDISHQHLPISTTALDENAGMITPKLPGVPP